MNELAELKTLTERVKLAEQYFGKELTETQRDKGLNQLQDILNDIVRLTLVIEKVYCRRIDWDLVDVVDEQIKMGV